MVAFHPLHFDATKKLVNEKKKTKKCAAPAVAAASIAEAIMK